MNISKRFVKGFLKFFLLVVVLNIIAFVSKKLYLWMVLLLGGCVIVLVFLILKKIIKRFLNQQPYDPNLIIKDIDNSEKRKLPRRDFWIVLMILCLIFIPITFSKFNSHGPKKDYNEEFPQKLFIISPTAEIVDSMEECNRLYLEKNNTIYFLRENLNEEQIEFIEDQNSKYNESEDVYQAIETLLFPLKNDSELIKTEDDKYSLSIKDPINLTVCTNILLEGLNESALADEDLEIIYKQKNEYFEEIIENYFEKIDVLDDSGFESGTWEDEVRDCCSGLEGEVNIWLEHSKDASTGKYSLKLASKNHCACVSQKFKNFSDKGTYLLTFDYKGDSPEYCIWISGVNNCMPAKKLEATKDWIREYQIFNFTDYSISSTLHFYTSADNNELKETYYDNVVIYRLKSGNISLIQNKMDNKLKDLMHKQMNVKIKNICKAFLNEEENGSFFISTQKGWVISGKETIDSKSFKDRNTFLLKGKELSGVEISYKYGLAYYVYLISLALLVLIFIYSFIKLIWYKR